MPVTIPNDRTRKQPIRAFCRNPECREQSTDTRFEFNVLDEKELHCPKCGDDAIGLLVLVHLLTKDPKRRGRLFRIACDPTRTVLATSTNLEAVTGEVDAVNCPGCLKVAHEQNVTTNQGTEITVKSDDK